ncbi:MAG: hypothetical protein LIP77_01000 [Planctomycetes bacterium]|nr:hypothetical protein [Planctomycetota bacterium]
MRTLLVTVLVWALAAASGAGDASRIFLPDLLPATTIVCVVPPDNSTLEREYAGSISQRFLEMPEMQAFLQSFEESRRAFAQDVSQTANVTPQLAYEILQSSLGFALLNIGLGRDGRVVPEFVFALSLTTRPDRETVYSAVMALLNRRDVIQNVLESQGLDPSLPLKTLAQEETISGYPPVLRIGPNIRVAALGNLILFYHGPGSDGIKKLFDAAANPGSALSHSGAFQAVYQGTEAGPGTSFGYVNMPRLVSILDALNMGQLTRVADALGLESVQSVGVAGAYRGEGVRHTLFAHIPSGAPSGLLSALIPMPADAPVGMEGFARIIPANAEAFLSLRVDIPTLLREFPYLLDSLGAVSRPGGMAGIVANERVLGVPLTDIVTTLGGDLVIRPHDDTQVLMFHNVNVAGFETIIAAMEQNAGTRFNSLNVGGYIVRYFNRRSSLTAPLAPAFCLVPHQAGNSQGILYMASHPQAVVSLIQELSSAREPVSNTRDFQIATTGMAGRYSLFYYNGHLDAYRRVYNFMLPVASLWSSSGLYPVDTGLLPTAQAIMPGLFGASYGARCLPDGIQVQAFSPIGMTAIMVTLADKLVVSNPLVIGFAYAFMEDLMKMFPGI